MIHTIGNGMRSGQSMKFYRPKKKKEEYLEMNTKKKASLLACQMVKFERLLIRADTHTHTHTKQ